MNHALDRSIPPSARRRRRARRLGLRLALGAVLATGALASGEAEAAIPAVLKPPPDNSRTMQFNFGFGPSTRIGGRYYYYGNCGGPGVGNGRCGWGAGYGGAFKLHQEFMGHLNGKWYGPALGVMMQEEFAGGYFGFNIAPRFTYDIHVYKPLALLVSPHVSLGYHLSHWNAYYYNNYFYYYGSPNYHAADLQFGVAVKLMIAQRWLVWVQTPSFDFHMGPGNYWCAAGAPGYYCGTYFAARFDVLAGGGVAF